MKHKISETGARMLKYQEQLADEYKYKPIPRTFFKDVRAEVEEALPEWCNMSGDTTKLETRSGTVIASGYNRIVIGVSKTRAMLSTSSIFGSRRTMTQT